MRELEQFLNTEADWVMEKLIASPFDTDDRIYYQGRLDQLANVRRLLKLPQIVKQN